MDDVGAQHAVSLQMTLPTLAAALIGLTAFPALAQFKSTVPLVVAPVTVTDAKGHPFNGLTADDLAFFDNSVPQKVQLQTLADPISLAVLIQAGLSSAAVLDKLAGSGILFSDLLAAYHGETAILTFSDTVNVAQDFTPDSTQLKGVLKKLRPRRDGGALYDGILDALQLLAKRDPARRRILLVIAERRDRGSKTKLDALLRDPSLQNATIYWLTYSTFLTPFTNKPHTVWDRMTDEQKKDPDRLQRIPFPFPNEEVGLPPDIAPGSLFNIFTALAQRTTVDAASLLSRTTGGRMFGFLKQDGLEEAIHAVADEVHQQYIVTFEPKTDVAGVFHALSAEVKGKPELKVRTRTGYWSVR
jgi:VWFA-related protein